MKDAEGKIKFFTDRIAALKEANPGSPRFRQTVLKAQGPALEAIAQESRRGGCGPKCLALKKDLADIMERAGRPKNSRSMKPCCSPLRTGLRGPRCREVDELRLIDRGKPHGHAVQALSLVRFQPVDNVTMTEREATNTGIMGASSLAFLLLAPAVLLRGRPQPSSWRSRCLDTREGGEVGSG